jgi:hypothetical protein
MTRDAGRRLVAFIAHAPGLWLVYREPLPRQLRRGNVLAILVTLAVMGGAWLAADQARRPAAIALAWLAGHLTWGAYLAARLPPRAHAP